MNAVAELSRVTRSAAETRAFAAEVSAAFGPGASYALEGDLGAGKTCFVQGLSDALGLRVAVSSPTFAIANEYLDPGSGRRLVHLDLYRLDGPQDLESIGWDDYVDSGDPLAVEWPDRAGRFLPASFVRVRFSIGPGPDDRTITASRVRPDVVTPRSGERQWLERSCF